MPLIPGESPPQRVLAAIDRAMLWLVGLGVVRLSLGPPATTPVHRAGTALLVVVAALALAGLAGRAPWRRLAYPVLALGAAAFSAAFTGPLAGSGALLVVSVLLAVTLGLSRRMYLAIAFVAAFTFAAPMIAYSGLLVPPDPRTVDLGVLRPWLRVSAMLAILLWLSVRVLELTRSALEDALAATANAYRAETSMRDQLTASQRALDEIEQIELVGRLAGGVAHDVNNALTAILAASEVIAEDAQTPTSRRQLAELEGASLQAAELVRDLLWIGRRFPPTTETAEVARTVETCRARLARLARTSSLDVRLAPGLRAAIAPERLEQILFWLVIRAHRGGIVELALLGAPAADDPEVVELVLTGSERRASPAPGPSKPLALVRAQLSTSAAQEVIEQAGGRMILIDAPDRLHVEIRIPAAAPTPTSVPLTTLGRTALIVDDEPLVLRRLATLVERRGFRVVTASSLAEAWPKLATGPDLLVTDLQLGDGRGEDLALASYEAAPTRPIIVCSGFGANDALRDRLRGAVLTFLPKPFTREELERALAAAPEHGP